MIFDKLEDVQAEIKVPKDQYNDFGKFKYRSVEDIYETAKPILKKHGVVLTLTDDIVCVADKPYIKATAADMIPRTDHITRWWRMPALMSTKKEWTHHR